MVVGKEMDEKVDEEVEILSYVEPKEVQIVKEVDRIDWCWLSFLQHMPPKASFIRSFHPNFEIIHSIDGANVL